MDLTVSATPIYTASIVGEMIATRKRAEREGPHRADYETRDTIASLVMGTGSLILPLMARRWIGKVRPDKTALGKAILAAGLGAAALTTAADTVVRRSERDDAADPRPEGDENRVRRRRRSRMARRAASVGGPTALGAAWLSVAAIWGGETNPKALFERRILPDMGNGVLPLAGAIVAWDFVYYWNHRLQHESRLMWAIHVVHHSSERYNLSTALRQPVADAIGAFVPHGSALFGVRPSQVETARAVNLLYQYWIHTDLIRRMGWFERWFNTPSHHRVHHGANQQYIDNNYGSILIIWDRLFGSFVEEGDEVVFGLTKNINTFNPVRVATHEYRDIVRDVAGSTNWSDRLSFVFRGPGWAYRRHADAAEVASASLVSAAA